MPFFFLFITFGAFAANLAVAAMSIHATRIRHAHYAIDDGVRFSF
jgi:hypothetical protein